MKKGFVGYLLGGLLLTVVMCGGFGMRAHAAEAELEITLSNGRSSDGLKDNSYGTVAKLNSGDTITVRATDGSLLSGIYVIWDSPAQPWTLIADEGIYSCGENGFLHEYIALDVPAEQATIEIPADGMRVSEVRGFGEGELPGDVQVWNPPCDRADIMMIPAHADDDILFMGGIIPTYGVAEGAEVQVVFMTEFWSTNRVREHEKLDGLWTDGLRNYPVSGDFYDHYSKSVEKAASQYDVEELSRFLVTQLRRFQPQVVVTHDLNGEYGHGYHMLVSKLLTEAVEKAGDEAFFPEAAEIYGTWDTPKTYLHLYKENKIRMDLRIPIEEMNGMTALEVATAAYKKHVSQQQWSFFVSDDYKHSCADFGLYRTKVGVDQNNSMLENIKLYSVQEAEEAARLAAEEAAREAERKAAEEAARAAKEAFRKAENTLSEETAKAVVKAAEEIQRDKMVRMAVCIVVAVIITIVLLSVARGGRKHRRRRR